MKHYGGMHNRRYVMKKRLRNCLSVIVFLLNGSYILGHSFNYDLIIIGAGAAGTFAAKKAHSMGKKVALIEKQRFGGCRVWSGDIPMRALIKIAKKVHSLSLCGELGINISKGSINYSVIHDYIQKVVAKVAKRYDPANFSDLQIDVFWGKPHFIDRNSIELNSQVLTADKFIIATGSRPKIPAFFKNIEVLTPDNFFDLTKLPRSVIIIGAGPLGCQVATTLAMLKVKTTLITRCPMILPALDAEIVDRAVEYMTGLGVNIQSNMFAKKAYKNNGRMHVNCIDLFGNGHAFQAEAIYLAVNRMPNLEDMHLDEIGVKIKAAGIAVDEYMCTSISNIYACGDVTAAINCKSSRLACYQAEIAVENAFSDTKRMRVSYDAIRRSIYAGESIAFAGLSEELARLQHGESTKIYRYPYCMIDISHGDRRAEGLAKFIFSDDGRLIGTHIIGKKSDEILNALMIGKRLDQQPQCFSKNLIISPSYLDIISYASVDSQRDFPKIEQEKNFFQSLYSMFQNIFRDRLQQGRSPRYKMVN